LGGVTLVLVVGLEDEYDAGTAFPPGVFVVVGETPGVARPAALKPITAVALGVKAGCTSDAFDDGDAAADAHPVNNNNKLKSVIQDNKRFKLFLLVSRQRCKYAHQLQNERMR
jgi:hypothetical protein